MDGIDARRGQLLTNVLRYLLIYKKYTLELKRIQVILNVKKVDKLNFNAASICKMIYILFNYLM